MDESISSVISESADDKFDEVNHEEYTLVMVNNDQGREDVSTTASDGDVNPSWLKVCKEMSKKKTMRTEA